MADALSRAADPGFERITSAEGLRPVLGKRLLLDENFVVMNGDGTLMGAFGAVVLNGTWVFEDGSFCRTLTEGPARAMETPFDCQVLELSETALRGQRAGHGRFFRVPDFLRFRPPPACPSPGPVWG
ncbi:MAG: hypothetical protein AAFY59_10325 [Pseudomonadota bacterium]